MDPEEMNNLANPEDPGYDKELLESMNVKLNALIEAEIGVDEQIFKPALPVERVISLPFDLKIIQS